MIFASMNEKGEPAWKLVLDGRKTITRRTKPQPIGAIRAVQAGRGKPGLGYIRIKSCMKHTEWLVARYWCSGRTKEANAEGFDTWLGLACWFDEHKIDMIDTYRIEFEVIGANESREKGKPCVGVEK